MPGFVFATGIENSAPLVLTADGRVERRDETIMSGHDRRFEEDFALAKALGVTHLRYGVPYYRVHTGPGRFDWDFSDAVFGALRRSGLIPIVDLCHFCVPDWLGGSFQNPELAPALEEYARAFAARYPWVRLFTPVNEMFIAARFSARFGWWNERQTDERSFVTALKHAAQANVRAARAIFEVQPGAAIVQSESSEFHGPADPDSVPYVLRLNEERFLPLDLAFGHDVSAAMYRYLMANGVTEDEYDWFLANALRSRVILGNDYYPTNEHVVYANGLIERSASPVGYYVVTHQYFDRYRRPMMHTEANLQDPLAASDWLMSLLRQTVQLIFNGVPMLGFTWYSLTDQLGWDDPRHLDPTHVNPLGLYDLDRRIRPVGETYRTVIAAWRERLTELTFGGQDSLW